MQERDPPIGLPGMVKLRLDPMGRLIGLEVEPTIPTGSVAVREASTEAAATEPATTRASVAWPAASMEAKSPDQAERDLYNRWRTLMSAAEIDSDVLQNRFKPTTPEGAPPVYTDAERARVDRHL